MKYTTPHIVQYQGSKRKLAPQILPLLPRNFKRLIEPFSGMAAMTIATAKEGRCGEFWINDINEPLVGVLKEAINDPKSLIHNYKDIWDEQFTYSNGSEAHYYYIREIFNNGNHTPSVMLYLLARCVKGAVRYGSNGNFNQSPDKRRNGTNPSTLATNVYSISKLLKGKCIFSSIDYKQVFEGAEDGDILYLDPPYQGVCTGRDNRYFSGIDFDEFIDSLQSLVDRGIMFILSYDGFCGEKEYGEKLPAELGLHKMLLDAGISTQSLFNGDKLRTKEALYISPSLINKGEYICPQLNLFE